MATSLAIGDFARAAHLSPPLPDKRTPVE